MYQKEWRCYDGLLLLPQLCSQSKGGGCIRVKTYSFLPRALGVAGFDVNYLSKIQEERTMANAVGIIIVIISLIIASMIVNKVYQLFMKLLGADFMFFSRKTKLVAIFIVWLIISGAFLRLFRIA